MRRSSVRAFTQSLCTVRTVRPRAAAISSFGEAAKKPTLDNAREARLELRQPIQCIIQLQQCLRLIIGTDLFFVERDSLVASASLERGPGFHTIHEDMPHGQRRQCKEMRAILPSRSRLIDEFEIGLVHQRGRLQGRAAIAQH